MSTKKLYYDNNYLTKCTGTIVEITPDGIILNQTVAYPEGGGQIGDVGIIANLSNNTSAQFIDTRKIGGRTLFLEDFPTINVECKIVHHISEENLPLFSVGDKVEVQIDVERRAKSTLNHSGLHLALMVFENLREDILKSIVGCKITDEYGRVDIRTDQKFSPEELDYIEKETEKLFSQNITIEQFYHEIEKEALYWKYLDYLIPCGGTHVDNTNAIANISVKRKNIGKGIDRLIITTTMSDDFIQKYI